MAKKTEKQTKKTAEIYGPLAASWTVSFVPETGGTSTIGTHERTRSTVAYFKREGRETRVVRSEHCPVPGCDGEGTRKVKKRGYVFHAEVPCVGCRGRHETAEELEVPDAGDKTLHQVLAELGYSTEDAEYGRKVITRGGWQVHRGTAGDVWNWLRETGQIL